MFVCFFCSMISYSFWSEAWGCTTYSNLFWTQTNISSLFLSTFHAVSVVSPPTTPPQPTKPSPPFPLEESRNLPMHQEERLRSLSSPSDTSQHFNVPSAKPPLTASSAPIATSLMVSALPYLSAPFFSLR